MTEVEQTLDTHKEIAVTQEEIKQQLSDLKVNQIFHSGVNRSESTFIFCVNNCLVVLSNAMFTKLLNFNYSCILIG